MILYTRRLVLRPWTIQDAESLYRHASDPRVGPAAGWPPHTDVENSREIIRTILSSEETYAICFIHDDNPVGSIGLLTGDRSNLRINRDEAELGYWLGRQYWGQGIVPEACREVIRHAFDDLQMRKIWCGYFEGNLNSRRVQEKCGFVYHHTNEDVYWEPVGETRTEHITCLKRMNWKYEMYLNSRRRQTDVDGGNQRV